MVIIILIKIIQIRYRSITGQCNNLENPHWGAAMNRWNTKIL